MYFANKIKLDKMKQRHLQYFMRNMAKRHRWPSTTPRATGLVSYTSVFKLIAVFWQRFVGLLNARFGRLPPRPQHSTQLRRNQ